MLLGESKSTYVVLLVKCTSPVFEWCHQKMAEKNN